MFINPYNGEIQGLSQYLNVRRFLREMHRNLMLPTPIGIPIVSTMAFLLLISLITGLLVYKKFWRNFFKLPSKRNLAAFWSGLHRLLGVWSIWFILLVFVTSFWYLYESLGGRAPSYRNVLAVHNNSGLSLNYHAMQKIAQQANPNLTVTQIIPASNPNRPALFYGETDELLVRARANFIAINTVTGEVVDQANTEQLSIHQKISEMADPLHFGTFGGLVSRIIWFVFGLILTLLSISAMRLYSLKLISSFEPHISAWKRFKNRLGLWYWLSISLILLAFIAWPFREY